MTHVSPREIIADAISGRAETDSIHLRQADAVLTALADAGFALTVRNRIAGVSIGVPLQAIGKVDDLPF